MTAAELRWCSPCRRMLPLDAFGRDRAQPAGLSYRCRGCDRAKSAAYYATPGAVVVRVDRQLIRDAVIGACGGACWCCGTDEALSVFRLGGARLRFNDLQAIAADIWGGQLDEDDVTEERGVVVSCAGCAPTPRAGGAAAVERLRQRLAERLRPRPPSTPRAA